MAAETNDRRFCKLNELETAVRTADLNNLHLKTDLFVVIAIHRYITDPVYVKQLDNSVVHSIDAFDVTLADGDVKRKLILANNLNHLVQQNQVGSIIHLTECAVKFDETDLQAESVVVIEGLNISGQTSSEEFANACDLPWYPESNLKQTKNIPLLSGRGCYVNVWTSADVVIPDGLSAASAPSDLDQQSALDLCCIKDLATRWGRLQSAKPPVLVKVVRKCRLVHYAKQDKGDKWPFQLHLLVSDKSGLCSVVLWNVLCLKYLKQIREGTVLLLKNFTVKKSFNMNFPWHLHENELELYPIDINLNAHHPEAEVLIVNNRSLSRQFRLDDLKHRFITRNQLTSLPDEVICDVAGVVIFVGRMEREVNVRGRSRGDSGGYWVKRWIHVQDHTQDKPFIIQVYKGQDPVFDAVKPFQTVMLRHLRIIHNISSLKTSKQQRHVYLTTTPLSQLVTLQQPLTPTVRAWMINLSRRLLDPDTQLDTSVGGYYSYPPLPHSLDEFRSQNPNIVITPCSAWIDTVENSSYRQHVQLYLQAKLAALKFQGQPSQGRKGKKSKIDSLEAVVNEATHENLSRFDSVGQHEVMHCHLQAANYKKGDKLGWLNLPPPDRLQHEITNVPDQDPEDMFVMTWQGLNSHVLLHTLRSVADTTFPRNPSFQDFVCGLYDNTSEICAPSMQNVKDIFQSAQACVDSRFLLVVDLYRDSCERTELVLNRAYVL